MQQLELDFSPAPVTVPSAALGADIIPLPLDRQSGLVGSIAMHVLSGRSAYDCEVNLYDKLNAEHDRLIAMGVAPAKADAEIRKLHIAVDLMIRGILSPVRTSA